MSHENRTTPTRYQRISLRGDPSGRTHHAVIFPTGESPENGMLAYEAKCKLPFPKLLTWTITGHGSIQNWNFADHEQSEQLTEQELALLVPRSLWVWFVPRIVRTLTPLRFLLPKQTKDLFYLESV